MIKGELRRKIRFRQVTPRTCQYCMKGYYKHGTFFCGEFPEEINFDAGDRTEGHYTCDLWSKR